MTTSFITTAIPYVNGNPHLGFAYELVLADILARHRRSRGRDVRSLTGSDDNSSGSITAARSRGLTTRDHVDHQVASFRALQPLLGIEVDDFVATSSDPRHRVAVHALWRACAARGDLYRKRWTGHYCTGCEAVIDSDHCAIHRRPAEAVSEDNWFFRLTRYREPIRDAIVSGRLDVTPEGPRNEVLAFLAGEIHDISVSRAAARTDGWGIRVPDDPDQTVAVWFDALANYVSSLDYGSPDSSLVERYWHGDERIHVIGKDIIRFHAVHWPAYLLSAGLPLPTRIAVHPFITLRASKLSKSDSSAFAVAPLVDRYGADAIRWYFARRCRTTSDTDYDESDIPRDFDNDLAHRLGNLVQRCVKLCDGVVPPRRDVPALRELIDALPARIDAALDRLAFHTAAEDCMRVLDQANRVVDEAAPWRHRDPSLVFAPLEAARIVARELTPFVPGVARTIDERLGRFEPGDPLPVGPPPLPRLG